MVCRKDISVEWLNNLVLREKVLWAEKNRSFMEKKKKKKTAQWLYMDFLLFVPWCDKLQKN